MARKTERPALVVSTEERSRLARLKDSRKAPKRAVERAAILLRYATATAPRRYKRRWVEPAHHTIIDKALAAVEAGLEDRYHRAKEPVITEDRRRGS